MLELDDNSSIDGNLQAIPGLLPPVLERPAQVVLAIDQVVFPEGVSLRYHSKHVVPVVIQLLVIGVDAPDEHIEVLVCVIEPDTCQP